MHSENVLDTDGSNAERAVSPVIGVILMVAITIILAAIIGTFVIGLGDQAQETAPNAQFTFEYDEDDGGSVTITHEGGEPIDSDSDTLEVIAPNGTAAWEDGTIRAGNRTSLNGDDLGEVNEGETIRVVWVGSDGTSATLARDDSPIDIS